MTLYTDYDTYKKGIVNIMEHTKRELDDKKVFIDLDGITDIKCDIYISDTMVQLFHIIPLISKITKGFLLSSYKGKHIVENLFVNKYISNGQFQLVMIALGFKYKIDRTNLIFNCTFTYKQVPAYPFFNGVF